MSKVPTDGRKEIGEELSKSATQETMVDRRGEEQASYKRVQINSPVAKEELSHYPMPKVEFPDFDGCNLDDWLYKSQRYFELECVPENRKVKLADLYMNGVVLQWHFTYIRNRGSQDYPGWKEYITAVARRFGKEVFEDPMGRMKNLKREGKFENLYAYMEEFDRCLRKVLERMDVPMEFQVSLFVNGLKEEYRNTLWLLRPTDLLSVQEYEDEEEEETKEEVNKYQEGADDEIKVTLQALHGERNEGEMTLHTMKLAGQFKWKTLNILVD
ncbi:hypothetical protein MLD38_033458 [Melastoma candidum]|uniref:Uncharacterized protein n=1 Tax=Melastoma candidum TaxID=119954 RepID=A0ACB9M6I0_9MYRT|nr:hypothetical protein MLD38_033458 [Melastoma candidum]